MWSDIRNIELLFQLQLSEPFTPKRFPHFVIDLLAYIEYPIRIDGMKGTL